MAIKRYPTSCKNQDQFKFTTFDKKVKNQQWNFYTLLHFKALAFTNSIKIHKVSSYCLTYLNYSNLQFID